MLLLAAVAVKIVGVVFGFDMGEKHTANCGPSRAPTAELAVMVVVPGADALAAVCGLDWQATVLGVGWTMGLMWIVSSKDRTRNLVTHP